MQIGLLSDTHGYLDNGIKAHLSDCDEIWHAGDWGSIEVADELEKITKTRGVYGNIDGQKIRVRFPEYVLFEIDGLKVLILHIGGYPGRYSKLGYHLIKKYRPGLFISGHSHIVKVTRDKSLQLLHFNPGAAGIFGMHKMRTIMKFKIENGKPTGLQLIELGLRGKI
jgi:uncharacterized protein